jgi:hypothetical protein
VKAYWGSEGIAPLIPNLGTSWRWMISFTARPLYTQGKSTWYALIWRLKYLYPEDGCTVVLRNFGIITQHYTASQPRRPRLEYTLLLGFTRITKIQAGRYNWMKNYESSWVKLFQNEFQWFNAQIFKAEMYCYIGNTIKNVVLQWDSLLFTVFR